MAASHADARMDRSVTSGQVIAMVGVWTSVLTRGTVCMFVNVCVCGCLN